MVVFCEKGEVGCFCVGDAIVACCGCCVDGSVAVFAAMVLGPDVVATVAVVEV